MIINSINSSGLTKSCTFQVTLVFGHAGILSPMPTFGQCGFGHVGGHFYSFLEINVFMRQLIVQIFFFYFFYFLNQKDDLELI